MGTSCHQSPNAKKVTICGFFLVKQRTYFYCSFTNDQDPDNILDHETGFLISFCAVCVHMSSWGHINVQWSVQEIHIHLFLSIYCFFGLWAVIRSSATFSRPVWRALWRSSCTDHQSKLFQIFLRRKKTWKNDESQIPGKLEKKEVWIALCN